MRLIDAPVGVFAFRGELVLKTEYMNILLHALSTETGGMMP